MSEIAAYAFKRSCTTKTCHKKDLKSPTMALFRSHFEIYKNPSEFSEMNLLDRLGHWLGRSGKSILHTDKKRLETEFDENEVIAGMCPV